MSDGDRERWNARYSARADEPAAAGPCLTAVERWLPRTGRALDVAGGAGRHALWLARRGLQVTLVDVADVGLRQAAARARREGLVLETLRLDLESDPFPPGPWAVIVCCYYLQRSLFSAFAAGLAPGGMLVFAQPTRTNLERNPRPSARFLLEDGELPRLVAGLQVIRYEERWFPEGQHEARLLARRRMDR